MNNFMTVVIKLPDDPVQRSKIAGNLKIDSDYHGGTVTAASNEDEITRLERYEELYGDLPDEA